MKHSIIVIIIAVIFYGSSVEAAQKPDYRGLLLLQVQSYGRMWYVHPRTNERYYIKDAKVARVLVGQLGAALSKKSLEKIPVSKGGYGDRKVTNQYRGRFITVAREVWYVHPKTGIRTYLGDTGEEIFDALKKQCRGVTDVQLRTLSTNTEQIIPDTAFGSVASARLHNGARDGGQYADTILPLASLTKLMTALVLLDHTPQWDRLVTITEAQIVYPKRYVGNDTTSEVSLKAGQRVSIDDLWTAMLVSSSNQAAIALIESTGLSEEKFVGEMNVKAKHLGLSKTYFFDGAGLDAHTVSTANETAALAQEAFSHERIAHVSSQKEATIVVRDLDGRVRTLPIQNRNYSVLAFEPEGVKTGFLVEAQRNVALKKGNSIIVVLHARSMKERNTMIKQLL